MLTKGATRGAPDAVEGAVRGTKTAMSQLPTPPTQAGQIAETGIKAEAKAPSGGAIGGLTALTREYAERVPRATQRASGVLSEAAAKAERIASSSPATGEAIRTGLDDAIVKTLTEADEPLIKASSRMVSIAEKGGIERPHIVAGEAAAQQFKLVDNQRKKVGQQLGEAIKRLPRGTTVDMTDSVNTLESLLRAVGVEDIKAGKLVFGSETSLSPSARSKVQELYNEVLSVLDNPTLLPLKGR